MSLNLDPRQIEVIDDRMAEVLRTKTPAERIHIGFTMWVSAKKMLTHHLTHTNPDWKEEQIFREVTRRLSRGAV
jgi:hypothetical protein